MESCTWVLSYGGQRQDMTFETGLYEIMFDMDAYEQPMNDAMFENRRTPRVTGVRLEAGRLVRLVAFAGPKNLSASSRLQNCVHMPYGQMFDGKWIQLTNADISPKVMHRELHNEPQQKKVVWLCNAVRNRDLCIVGDLLETRSVHPAEALISEDSKTSHDVTAVSALHLAAKVGDAIVAGPLISYGANKDAKDGEGKTPLHWALENNNAVFAEWLVVSCGADVNSVNLYHETPLHNAVTRSHVATVRSYVSLLTRSGSKDAGRLNVQSQDGVTALHMAAQRGDVDICRTLVEHGADTNAKDTLGRTPAEVALTDEAEAAVQAKGFLSRMFGS